MAEQPGRALAAYVLRRDAGSDEALADACLIAPGHRADEARRRRRGVSRADAQRFGDQGRIAGDPIAHHDAPAAPGYADHFSRDVVGSRGEHRAEDADDEVETAVANAVEVGRVALHE